VNLTLADLRALPFASALIGSDGEVIANTPEWRGDGPGSTSYPVRRSRLVVCVEPAAPRCAALLGSVLDELDAASAEAVPPYALQLRMLAASLRVVAGRSVHEHDVLSAGEVLQLAQAGIEARTGLRHRVVGYERGSAVAVRGGEAAALVLVQLAVNAERHDAATAVHLTAATGELRIEWESASTASVSTARRRQDRQRWGLGFARIAADAIGGVVHPPRRSGDRMVMAALEFGVPRLSLPLAAVRNGHVVRATRAWDDETGAIPGTPVITMPRLLDAGHAAASTPGSIARAATFTARQAGELTWIAVPPDDVADRARDVIDGLTHEQALVDGVAEPRRSRINALAQLLAHALGAPLQRVPSSAWVQRMRTLAGLYGLPMPVPEPAGVGATDPAVSALLAAEAGERFEVDGDALWLVLRPNTDNSPLTAALLSEGRGRVRLG